MGIKEEWLENFSNESTVKNYEIAIRHFEEFIDDNLDDYLQKLRNDEADGWKRFWEDLKDYWKSLSYLAPITQNNKVSAVKLFFEEHSIKIPESEWSKFRRRKMKPSRPITDDKAGSREEWRKIINNTVNPAGKALFLVLLSTGARIGEMLQVKTDDLDLDSEPARIHLRAEYTKKGISDRYVFLTNEAKEHLLNYLEWRRGRKKRNGEPYDTERIFPFTRPNATKILKNAQEKAGVEEKDNKTGRRRIHIHSTRKFFRSNCGLEDALTHSIMGHREYLDRSYLRVNPDRAGKEFAKNMENLQVLEVGKTSETRLRETEISMLKASLIATGVSEGKIDEAIDKWIDTYEVLSELDSADEVKAELLKSSKPSKALESIDLGMLSLDAFQNLKEELLNLASEKSESRQKVIEEDKLEEHLNKGWKYVDQNNNGKVIVEK
ncbi:hypothetical protein AKJ65_01005 [candidate division MSBL1 archaeon SCGC-AAA259E19]|uniref:Tyr recombinase domain-containing protein n=1 Tax=candidate division MSBL1 archaeon SCGC-AAA259E19 TaxID=1698264 RepID=A0A133UNE8_9EURY|nr:hypothetical protein AKJ65_01005 [candidate division MSBL1 archaeon SCGC-AAA259E19]